MEIEVDAPERLTSKKMNRFNFEFYVAERKLDARDVLHIAVELLGALES